MRRSDISYIKYLGRVRKGKGAQFLHISHALFLLTRQPRYSM